MRQQLQPILLRLGQCPNLSMAQLQAAVRGSMKWWLVLTTWSSSRTPRRGGCLVEPHASSTCELVPTTCCLLGPCLKRCMTQIVCACSDNCICKLLHPLAHQLAPHPPLPCKEQECLQVATCSHCGDFAHARISDMHGAYCVPPIRSLAQVVKTC